MCFFLAMLTCQQACDTTLAHALLMFTCCLSLSHSWAVNHAAFRSTDSCFIKTLFKLLSTTFKLVSHNIYKYLWSHNTVFIFVKKCILLSTQKKNIPNSLALWSILNLKNPSHELWEVISRLFTSHLFFIRRMNQKWSGIALCSSFAWLCWGMQLHK